MKVALLGVPDDTGVKLNNGRPGAAGGPEALRKALLRYGKRYDLHRDAPIEAIHDAGNVDVDLGGTAEAMARTHQRTRLRLNQLHEQGYATVLVGGGHDHAVSSLAAAADHHGGPVGAINVDAHLDVRPIAGSGMPFRRAMQAGHLDGHHFVEWGLGLFANEPGHIEWARSKGARLVSVEEVQAGASVSAVLRHALAPGAAVLSVDLDALDASVAPGVSALNPHGLATHHVVSMVREAASGGVVHLDLMELNPRYDVDGRTARVAAHLLLVFASTLSSR